MTFTLDESTLDIRPAGRALLAEVDERLQRCGELTTTFGEMADAQVRVTQIYEPMKAFFAAKEKAIADGKPKEQWLTPRPLSGIFSRNITPFEDYTDPKREGYVRESRARFHAFYGLNYKAPITSPDEIATCVLIARGKACDVGGKSVQVLDLVDKAPNPRMPMLV